MIRFIRVDNENGKQVGVKIEYDYNNRMHSEMAYRYNGIDKEEIMNFKKQLYKNRIKLIKELEGEQRLKQRRDRLAKFLNTITLQDHLNVQDLKALLKFIPSIHYSYGLIDTATITETKKGIKVNDMHDLNTYMYNDSKYKFYKENFTIYE